MNLSRKIAHWYPINLSLRSKLAMSVMGVSLELARAKVDELHKMSFTIMFTVAMSGGCLHIAESISGHYFND